MGCDGGWVVVVGGLWWWVGCGGGWEIGDYGDYESLR